MEPHELTEFQPVALTREEVLKWTMDNPSLCVVSAEDIADCEPHDWRVLTAFTFAQSQIPDDVFYIVEPIQVYDFPTEADKVQIVNEQVARKLAARGYSEVSRYTRLVEYTSAWHWMTDTHVRRGSVGAPPRYAPRVMIVSHGQREKANAPYPTRFDGQTLWLG